MQLHPFYAPDDNQGGEEKRFTEGEMLSLLEQRLSAETQRYEAALQNEAAARMQAEAALREREEQLRTHEMRIKAQDALKARELPEQLLNMLNLSSEDALHHSLSTAESAFRAALEEGVRSRLRGQAPSLVPLPQKNRKTRSLSYQEAAANYMRDCQNH